MNQAQRDETRHGLPLTDLAQRWRANAYRDRYRLTGTDEEVLSAGLELESQDSTTKELAAQVNHAFWAGFIVGGACTLLLGVAVVALATGGDR